MPYFGVAKDPLLQTGFQSEYCQKDSTIDNNKNLARAIEQVVRVFKDVSKVPQGYDKKELPSLEYN